MTKIFTPAEMQEILAPQHETPTTKHLKVIQEYVDLLNKIEDGGGAFIEAVAADRPKIRRRLKKAARLAGVELEFRSHYRGGELFRVYHNAETE